MLSFIGLWHTRNASIGVDTVHQCTHTTASTSTKSSRCTSTRCSSASGNKQATNAKSNLDHSGDIRNKQAGKVMRRGVTPFKVSAAKNCASCSITFPSASFGNLCTRDNFKQRQDHLDPPFSSNQCVTCVSACVVDSRVGPISVGRGRGRAVVELDDGAGGDVDLLHQVLLLLPHLALGWVEGRWWRGRHRGKCSAPLEVGFNFSFYCFF